jgi:membrane-bound serine protease (ClpP class)
MKPESTNKSSMPNRFARQLKSICHRLAGAVSALGLSIILGTSVASTTQPSQSPSGVAAAVPAFRQANNVAILTVDGIIDNVTLWSLERRMKQARQSGADAVVIEINTFGGEMTATLDICNLLKDRGDTPANVVAWVNPNAYSAGAIMALACREIVVAPGATFGDAAPVALGPLGLQSLGPTERAKLLAPLQKELIDSARRNHYDENLVRSFVEIGHELWMIEHVSTGERVFVDRQEYKAVFGQEPPQQIGSRPSVAPPYSHQRLLPWINQTVPRAEHNRSLSPDENQHESEFEPMLPPVRSSLTETDRGQWKLVAQVTDANSLLTIGPDEAVYYGIATVVVANETDLKNYFGAQTITRYNQTWSENLVRFLISLPVKIVLIVVFLVCLFIELAMPGFGVFGTASIVALLILLGAPALVGLAQWWDILLVVIGLLLIAAELFVLPGMGIAGVAGVLCLLVGIVGTFVSDDLSTVSGQNEMWTGLATTLTSMFLAGIVIWFVSRQIHSFPFFNRLILQTELKGSTTGVAEAGLLEAMRSAPIQQVFPGDIGKAETDLRPAGRATFNGRLVDVQSSGTYIERGKEIRVVSTDRYVIEVEEATT